MHYLSLRKLRTILSRNNVKVDDQIKCPWFEDHRFQAANVEAE